MRFENAVLPTESEIGLFVKPLLSVRQLDAVYEGIDTGCPDGPPSPPSPEAAAWHSHVFEELAREHPTKDCYSPYIDLYAPLEFFKNHESGAAVTNVIADYVRRDGAIVGFAYTPEIFTDEVAALRFRFHIRPTRRRKFI